MVSSNWYGGTESRGSRANQAAVVKTLREWRAEKLLTIRDLAARANVSNQTIVQVEHGRISPRTRTIRRLCDALGVSPDEVAEFQEAIRRTLDDGDVDDALEDPAEGVPEGAPNRLQPLIETMPATSLGGISGESTVGFILAPDGSVSYASPSLERVMGPDANWRTGADIFDTIIQFVHPDDQYETMRLIHYLLVTPGGIDEISYRVRFADGEWHDMRLHGTNLVDHPAIEGVVLVSGPMPEA